MAAPVEAAAAVPAVVLVYDGFGTPTSFRLAGRVLEDKGRYRADAKASSADNLAANLRALESDELEGIAVRVAIAKETYEATTDDDGVFTVEAKNLSARLPLGIVSVQARVTSPSAKARIGRGRLFIHPDAPFVAVISDIDDTVVKTHVTRKVDLLTNALLKNAAQLEPVKGASASYRRARDFGARAFFYVSGSPQNFYPRLASYLAGRRFPAGPLLLKNLGEDALFAQEGYKERQIGVLLEMYPRMKVVLVGDSGERDPEIYRSIRQRNTDRLLGIVIRKTEGSNVEGTRFEGMTAFEDPYPIDAISSFVRPEASLRR